MHVTVCICLNPIVMSSWLRGVVYFKGVAEAISMRE
jgi:hypothetical protein